MNVQQYLAKSFDRRNTSVVVTSDGKLEVIVPNRYIKPVRATLRDHSRFQMKVLSELTTVDYLGADTNKPRFVVVYSLLSIRWCIRLIVKSYLDEFTALDSVVTIYPAANWYEREIYDRYGINFRDHPDLRRLLTDYGFEGHPLRKDFPLTGYTEVRFDEQEKRVVHENVTLGQERSNY